MQSNNSRNQDFFYLNSHPYKGALENLSQKETRFFDERGREVLRSRDFITLSVELAALKVSGMDFVTLEDVLNHCLNRLNFFPSVLSTLMPRLDDMLEDMGFQLEKTKINHKDILNNPMAVSKSSTTTESDPYITPYTPESNSEERSLKKQRVLGNYQEDEFSNYSVEMPQPQKISKTVVKKDERSNVEHIFTTVPLQLFSMPPDRMPQPRVNKRERSPLFTTVPFQLTPVQREMKPEPRENKREQSPLLTTYPFQLTEIESENNRKPDVKVREQSPTFTSYPIQITPTQPVNSRQPQVTEREIVAPTQPENRSRPRVAEREICKYQGVFFISKAFDGPVGPSASKDLTVTMIYDPIYPKDANRP